MYKTPDADTGILAMETALPGLGEISRGKTVISRGETALISAPAVLVMISGF